MKKRSLAALAATTLIAVATASIALPQFAHAQASAAATTNATAPASDAPAAPQAAAPAADQPAPPPMPAATETVNNPYGLGALWKNGDFVARFVLILLVIMSMGSWYIMITKF